MSGHTFPSDLLRRSRRGPGAATPVGTAVEVVLGAGLLVVAAIAGLVFVHRPWPNRVDTLVDNQLSANYYSSWAHHVTTLGSLPVLVVGVAVLFLVGLTRDWVRAFSCAIAPVAAVVIVDKLAKPLVGRHFGLGGSSTYPSGTVAAVVALATAAVLVAPRVARLPVAVLGVAATLAVSAAVIVLRWHYPTDALGGMAVGAGSVLAIDGLFHVPWAITRWTSRSRPAHSPPPGDHPLPTRGALPG